MNDTMPSAGDIAEPVDAERPTEAELRAFVGPKADYYVRVWLPYLDGTASHAKMNWAGFLLSLLWLGYRKVYGPLVVLYTILVIEVLVEDFVVLPWLGRASMPSTWSLAVNLAFAAICGKLGSYWYLQRAERTIAAVRAAGGPPEEQLAEIARRGGRSVWSAVATTIAAFVGMLSIYIPFGMWLGLPPG